MFSVGGSPSLNLSGASGEPGDRERQGERKKEGAKFFCQCHLVGQCKYTSLSTGAMERRGVGYSFWSRAVCLSGVLRWLCLAGSLCVGSPAAALFTFGVSKGWVKHSWGTLCFFKG